MKEGSQHSRNVREDNLQFSLVEGSKGKDWVATMAVWLSGISALIYFLTSYAVRNHILFLVQSLEKLIATLK